MLSKGSSMFIHWGLPWRFLKRIEYSFNHFGVLWIAGFALVICWHSSLWPRTDCKTDVEHNGFVIVLAMQHVEVHCHLRVLNTIMPVWGSSYVVQAMTLKRMTSPSVELMECAGEKQATVIYELPETKSIGTFILHKKPANPIWIVAAYARIHVTQ